MKLEVNVKEWIALYVLLERQTTDDKHIAEVRNKMRAMLVSILNDVERNMFERWFHQTSEKVKNLKTDEKQESSRILTLDDEELHETTSYPSVKKTQHNRRQSLKK